MGNDVMLEQIPAVIKVEPQISIRPNDRVPKQGEEEVAEQEKHVQWGKTGRLLKMWEALLEYSPGHVMR